MVKHIVFFKLQENAEGKSKLENAQIIKDGLLALLDKVPFLKAEEVGINIPNAPKTDHDICLMCEFETWDDLNAYQVHPEHVKVAQYIGKVKTADGRAAVDWEF